MYFEVGFKRLQGVVRVIGVYTPGYFDWHNGFSLYILEISYKYEYIEMRDIVVMEIPITIHTGPQ